MSNRLERLSAILAKVETTPGVDATPSGAANAIQVTNLTVRPLVANNVPREILRPYLGGSQHLIGTTYKELSFDVELAGSGTAGAAPAWGALLRGCGWAETITAATRVDYTLVSTGQESLTLYAYKDGVRHVLLGSMGDWSVKAKVGSIPGVTFRFIGIDGSETANAAPSMDFTGWKTPEVVTDANTADVVLGGTCSTSGAPTITSGTAVISDGLEINGGNDVPFTPLIGLQSISITGREITGRIMLDETAAGEVSRMASVRANTLTAVSMVHGTGTGKKVLFHLASAQLLDMSYEEVNGKLMQGYNIRAVPTPGGSGNDEARIVAGF